MAALQVLTDKLTCETEREAELPGYAFPSWSLGTRFARVLICYDRCSVRSLAFTDLCPELILSVLRHEKGSDRGYVRRNMFADVTFTKLCRAPKQFLCWIEHQTRMETILRLYDSHNDADIDFFVALTMENERRLRNVLGEFGFGSTVGAGNPFIQEHSSFALSVGCDRITQMVEATTSVIPKILPAVGTRCSMNHFTSAATTTWERPTTLTRAGEPDAKALVKQSCPTVAASPTPINLTMPAESTGRIGVDTGTNNQTTRLQVVATPEKCATTARVSRCLTRCRLINATPLNMPAKIAIGIAVFGVEKLLGKVLVPVLLE